MVRPFSEENIGSSLIIRTFFPDVNSEELKWHWDEEDRNIFFLGENDWKYQIEDALPKPCKGSITISAGTWHRVIKGKSELKVQITKC